MAEQGKTFDPREMPRAKRDAGDAPASLALESGGKSVSLFLLGKAPRPVLYVHMPRAAAAATAALLEGTDLVLAAVDGVDWERELSPWPAQRAFKGGRDFSGGADAYLAALTGTIVPAAEAALGETPLWRGIAGYSLAGLFAVYAVWKTDRFSRFASVSGSLWYDGFLDLLRGGEPAALPEAAYFSLGDLEKNTRSARLAAVEDRTREAGALLRARGVRTVLEMNEGGHFADAEARVARAVRRLCEL